MLSTQNLQALPDIDRLKQISKAIAVLDAIISPEWVFRYFSYNAKWSEEEECATMQDGEGDEYLLMFNQYGAILNGLAQGIELWKPTMDLIPREFRTFLVEEPVKSLGATFCIWKKYGDQGWHAGHNVLTETDPFGDGSEDLLTMLDGKPETYKAWAEEYYENELAGKLPLVIIQQIYQGQPLTKSMVLALNPNLSDWEELKSELVEIGYPSMLA